MLLFLLHNYERLKTAMYSDLGKTGFAPTDLRVV